MSNEQFERQYVEATRRGAEALRSQPLATRVRCDGRRVVINLDNGCTLSVPAHLLQGLRGAPLRELKRVRILGPGLVIEWPTIDMQFTSQGLLSGVFGTKTWMAELGRCAGKLSAQARIQPARRNGKRAGRPKVAAVPR